MIAILIGPWMSQLTNKCMTTLCIKANGIGGFEKDSGLTYIDDRMCTTINNHIISLSISKINNGWSVYDSSTKTRHDY